MRQFRATWPILLALIAGCAVTVQAPSVGPALPKPAAKAPGADAKPAAVAASPVAAAPATPAGASSLGPGVASAAGVALAPKGSPRPLQVPTRFLPPLPAAIAALIGQDGATLIGNDGSSLIGNDGSSLRGAGASRYGLRQAPPNADCLVTVDPDQMAGLLRFELDFAAQLVHSSQTLLGGTVGQVPERTLMPVQVGVVEVFAAWERRGETGAIVYGWKDDSATDEARLVAVEFSDATHGRTVALAGGGILPGDGLMVLEFDLSSGRTRVDIEGRLGLPGHWQTNVHHEEFSAPPGEPFMFRSAHLQFQDGKDCMKRGTMTARFSEDGTGAIRHAYVPPGGGPMVYTTPTAGTRLTPDAETGYYVGANGKALSLPPTAGLSGMLPEPADMWPPAEMPAGGLATSARYDWPAPLSEPPKPPSS